MDFDAEKLFPEHLRETLRRTGLHKVAGAMLGIDEVTLKEAVAVIGARAYLQRHENQKIAAGIKAFAELTGEKVAENPMLDLGGALLRRGLPMAALTTGVSLAPKLLHGEHIDATDALLPAAAGLIGGAGAAGYRGLKNNPGLVEPLTNMLRTR
jgi:hypothetical protein